jgi:hypothetical protein
MANETTKTGRTSQMNIGASLTDECAAGDSGVKCTPVTSPDPSSDDISGEGVPANVSSRTGVVGLGT